MERPNFVITGCTAVGALSSTPRSPGTAQPSQFLLLGNFHRCLVSIFHPLLSPLHESLCGVQFSINTAKCYPQIQFGEIIAHSLVSGKFYSESGNFNSLFFPGNKQDERKINSHNVCEEINRRNK